MEKFSAYRDAGTGIQPFLTPIPSNAPPILLQIVQPLLYTFAVLRSLSCIIVLAEHAALLILILPFYPIRPLYRFLSWLFMAINCRMILTLGGYSWIPVEAVSKKKARTQVAESWKPKAGDIIVSNWCSWAEVLWLAARFDPIFILPVAPLPATPSDNGTTPGRRTGTGSAAVHRSMADRTPIQGFHPVSVWKVLSSLGQTPATNGLSLEGAQSLEEIRKHADRPIVVFPECTTSNGRGLLRFADVFDPSISLPVRAFKVFIMCARYDVPTHWKPTATYSLPTSLPLSIPEPLLHIFTIPLEPSSLTIRLLPPSESPSSGSFLSGEIILAGGSKDTLTEACSVLMSQVGKLKRTGQGWEEKTSFLAFYRSKR